MTTTTYLLANLAMLALAGMVALVLLWIDAPYGRHLRSGWGPTIPARIGWIVMEAPAAIVLPVLVIGFAPLSAWTLLFIGLWSVHYLYRAFVYPFATHSSRRIPILVVAMGVTFNSINGGLNSAFFILLPAPEQPVANLMFIPGLLLFSGGLLVTRRADKQLAELKRQNNGGYAVPQGALYRWVSCPNYLGETVQWFGWAAATGSLAGLTFACWTAANLIPRALAHHRWYRQTFAHYPAQRKAIIPLLL